jgi:MFS family permease
VIRPAAILYVFAIMMTSLCHKYWQFMLSQGVLMGIAMGLIQFPAMAAVTQYFDKKRAAALGAAISGSSIGGVVMPIALSKMLNSTNIGFGWSVRIIGFIVIPLLAFSCVTVKPRLPPRKTNFFIPAAFKDPRYGLIIAAMFFMLIGMFAPLFYVPTYAVTRGIDATLASYLLAILNAASTFGRIIPGIMADKFGRLNVFTIGGITTGIVIMCLNEAKSTPALVVYSLAVGFSSGTIISGGSAAFTICIKNPQEAGAYMGMGLGIASLAALIGPPVNGAFVTHYGGFSQMSIFSGVMCIFGGFIALGAKAVTPQGIFGRT